MNGLIKAKKFGGVIYLSDVNDLLRIKIPEFWESRVLDDAIEEHVIYGEFALWLQALLSKNDGKNSELIQRSCSLIQELVEKGVDEVKNLVEVSIFEPIVDEIEEFDNFRKNFTGETLALLNKVKMDS